MHFEREFGPGGLFERVPVSGPPTVDIAARDLERILVDVVHDGAVIPQEFRVGRMGEEFPESLYMDHYVSERDWGAAVMARELAQALGLPAFYRVNLARVLMDFGRFPGSTPRAAPHLQRFAINYPFSELLDFGQKRALLERYYDTISDEMDRVVKPRRLKLAMHTYDPYNSNGTLRAPVSLITRVDGLHKDEVTEAFDPLYPPQLGEWTCDRILRNRISLTVEKAGFGVAHNFPYTLPEGSIEVRSQVWRFFAFLEESFSKAHPETQGDPAFLAVWDMLLDTNRRDAQAQMLRAYIHHFQRAPLGKEQEFAASQRAYERVRAFVDAGDGRVVQAYRYAPSRPSAVAIEVRKDLIFDYDELGRPTGEPLPSARAIAQAIAEALRIYLKIDRPEQATKRV